MPLSNGWLYVIERVPGETPSVCRLSWSSNPRQDFVRYRRSAPEAMVLRTWRCHWDQYHAAIEAMTAWPDCRFVYYSRYECGDVDALLARGDQFFAAASKESVSC